MHEKNETEKRESVVYSTEREDEVTFLRLDDLCIE